MTESTATKMPSCLSRLLNLMLAKKSGSISPLARFPDSQIGRQGIQTISVMQSGDLHMLRNGKV